MTDWAGKLAEDVARLAGLLHVARLQDTRDLPVEAETMRNAITVGEYLIAHARAAYAEMGTDPIVEQAKFVSRWISRK